MSYHRLKMDEVNKIIDDLWRDTYDGGGRLRCYSSSLVQPLTPSPLRGGKPCRTDIETIRLTAEYEGRAGKRSYHYRVYASAAGAMSGAQYGRSHFETSTDFY